MTFYNFGLKLGEELFMAINKARLISGLEPIGKVENYFPFLVNVYEAMKNGVDLTSGSRLQVEPYLANDVIPWRHAKKRWGTKVPIELNFEKILAQYADSATNHIHMAPIISKVRDLTDKIMGEVTDPQTGKVSNKVVVNLADQAPNFYEMLTKTVNYIATGKAVGELTPWLDKKIRALTKNTGMAIVSGGFRIMFVQPTSFLFNAYKDLGAKYAIKGVEGYLNDSMRTYALKKGNLVGRANETALLETFSDLMYRHSSGTGTLKDRASAIYQAIGEKGAEGTTILDRMSATLTWIGAYKMAKDNPTKYGFTREQEFINFANDIVTKTQASASKLGRAPVQRSAVGGMLTQFWTFSIAQWNDVMRGVLGYKNPTVKNAERFTKLFRMVVAASILSTIYEDFLGVRTPIPSPLRAMKTAYDKGDESIDVLWEGMKEIMQLFPPTAGARYGFELGGPVGTAVNRTIKAAADQYMGKPIPFFENFGEEIGGKKLGKFVGLAVEEGAKLKGVPGSAQFFTSLRRMDRDYTILQTLFGPRETKEPGVIEGGRFQLED
jgi:hypothetical protein